MGKHTQLALLLHLALLLFVMHQPAGVGAQLTIGLTTMNPSSGDGTPNTFISTGNQIGGGLLGSATPALMWGIVSSADVNAVCTQIVNTASLSFDINVETTSGTTTSLAMQITAIGGCLSASDGSGTEAVMLDNTGRQSALVCPSNSSSTGCAVYLVGDDVTSLYNQGARRRLLSSHGLLDAASDCETDAETGAISGVVTSIFSSRELLDAASDCTTGALQGTVTGLGDAEDCDGLGLFAVFCVAGFVGVDVLAGETDCIADGGSSCFPGDATVSLASGEVKRMTALTLGDKVAVRMNDGGVAYEDVYAFGHKDAMAVAGYVQLHLKPINMASSSFQIRTLELSPLHFAPVLAGNAGEVLYKRGQDITVGDQMWAQGLPTADKATMFVVTSISRVKKEGLYNPFTLGGTIIVNGVVASTHSDWFLDTTFESLGINTHWLPAAYQMVLLPVRMLYRILGKDLYVSIYHRLDAELNLAEVGTTRVDSILASVGATSAIIAALLLCKLAANSNHGLK